MNIMPTFDVKREEVTAFEVDGTYLFKQYFDRKDVFDTLESYYNNDRYRFEIPEGGLSEVQQILYEYFFDLRIEDDMYNYCVVMEQRADYSDLLRTSVYTKRSGGNIVFLMKDLLSVEQAVEQCATRPQRPIPTRDYRMENRLIIPARLAMKVALSQASLSGFKVGLH